LPSEGLSRRPKVNRGIESPERYVLQIFWDTLEDHTMWAFVESPLFTEWRAIVGPFFAAPPHVEHFELTVKVGLKPKGQAPLHGGASRRLMPCTKRLSKCMN
jgi:hypothetical protein